MSAEEPDITEQDVIAYLALKLDDDDKWRRVVELAKTEGSWVQSMIAEMERRCADPFGGIDWVRVAAGCMEEWEESSAETRVVDDADSSSAEDPEERMSQLNSGAARAYEMADFRRAIALATEAHDLAVNSGNTDSSIYATSLNVLGRTYHRIGAYDQARPLYEKACEVDRRTLGASHPNYARDLRDLAEHLCIFGNHVEAESACEEAIGVLRASVGKDHPKFARALDVLGLINYERGDFNEAERLYRRALDIDKKVLSEDHPDYATDLNNVADILCDRGAYDEAERLYRQALEIDYRALGEKHPEYGRDLHNLAQLYRCRENYKAAEPLYLKAIEIDRQSFGEDHPDYGIGLNHLADLYRDQEKHEEAEKLYRRSMEIDLRKFGRGRDYAIGLNNLAETFREDGRHKEAEALYREALEIDRSVLGEAHPSFAASLNNLGVCLREMGSYRKAESLLREALTIREAVLGERHPECAESLHELALVHGATNRARGAFELLQRCAQIDDEFIRQVFSIESPSERLEYLGSFKKPFFAGLSLVHQYFPNEPEMVRWALDLTIRRKALEQEQVAEDRDATLCAKYPQYAERIRDASIVRREVVLRKLQVDRLKDAPSYREELRERELATYRVDIEEVEDRARRLEDELAADIPEVAGERRLWTASRSEVARCLDMDAALAEFVKLEVFDFNAVVAKGEEQWKDDRYIAFVFPAEEHDKVTMVDLGASEAIEEIMEVQESILLRRAIFDPLLDAAAGKNELVLSLDGILKDVRYESLRTDDGNEVGLSYKFKYLLTSRDLVRQSA